MNIDNKNKEKEALLELLDLDFFQKIQDKLASEFGIASIITDIDGNPITNPSNFSSFCINYIRNTNKGLSNCKYCDALGGVSAKKFMKPVIYSCHTGLTDFASPIIVGGRLVGCFLCGQIMTNNLSKEHFKKITKKLEIDEKNLDEALKKIRVIPFEKVQYFANFLFQISTKISNFSYYQSVGNSATKTLENDLKNLFSIIDYSNEEKKEKFLNLLLNKFKLLFKKNSLKNSDIKNNLKILDENFTFTSNKIKNFNNKLKNFKI